MRRGLLATLVVAAMGLAATALAASGWHEYKDRFESGGYSGNDGSLAWAGPWKEVGESDGPSSGLVQATGSGCSGQCLSIGTGLLGLGAGAYRLADTADFAETRLSYSVDFDGGLLGLLNASLTVSATSNGGGSWSTIDSIPLGAGGGQTRQVNVTAFQDDAFGVRFTVSGAAGARVLIDDVRVAGEIPPPPTTTTSTTTTSTTTTSTTTTTTTLPKLTTTTLPKLTTTLPGLTPTTLPGVSPTLPGLTTTTRPTTTTTSPDTSATTAVDDGEQSPATTSSSSSSSTTTLPLAAGGGGPDDPGSGPEDGEGGGGGAAPSGLRATAFGPQSDFNRELFGSAPEVLGFEIAPGFSDAVELVEASWVWVLALALLIASALVKGIDRRVTPVTEPQP